MFVPVRAVQEGWRVYFARRQRRGFGLPSSSSVPPEHRSTLCRPWRPQNNHNWMRVSIRAAAWVARRPREARATARFQPIYKVGMLVLAESGETCSEIDGCHPLGWKRSPAWALMATDHLDRDGNKHMMIDLGTGNNNKINGALKNKQEFIDIVETVYRSATKGSGLVCAYCSRHVEKDLSPVHEPL
ncbi:hypothetical protein Cgig2_009812 [Carnegiea gigantea]|uniref:Uncharacterized protein n=1 Tax=Carnegiea gigantea TaxID=171969 RepID=A0A9Q1Q567_9CARY|nr:hypothetical protein Cgig2_009812 [Carnegiea gigantea]